MEKTAWSRDRRPADSTRTLNAQDRVSLCEALDRVLNRGVVVAGEITVSVADIDLVYLGLQLVVTSIEKGRELGWTGSSIRTEAPSAFRQATDGPR